MADMLRRREISATELVTAHLARVDEVNPGLNALVTVTGEQALEQARLADDHAASGEFIGPLHGLPVAHKDLQDTRGVRTTYGSRVFAEHVPDSDSLLVERMSAAGAISLGKTNTPEFGTGSQTYNDVFGPTRNPYDPAMTSGGSSGGAAAALATGMVALADGSDMAGSLRNPASV
jgi:amidase